jgi:hypothetical protein
MELSIPARSKRIGDYAFTDGGSRGYDVHEVLEQQIIEMRARQVSG